MNQEYQIASVPTSNTFTIVAKDTSGSTVTASASDSGNGGGSTVGAYQINVGLDNMVGGTGWSAGTWGRGTWNSSASVTVEGQLRLWSHDNFGEDLLINPRDGEYFCGIKQMAQEQEQLKLVRLQEQVMHQLLLNKFWFLIVTVMLLRLAQIQ